MLSTLNASEWGGREMLLTENQQGIYHLSAEQQLKEAQRWPVVHVRNPNQNVQGTYAYKCGFKIRSQLACSASPNLIWICITNEEPAGSKT